jgi:hypothetical protein
MFQTRPDEADLLYPHILHASADRRSDADRRREFQREMQSLPRQHCYYLAKGHPALPCRTPDVPAPSEAAGKRDEELLDIFDREIAPSSMIGIDVAARLIAEWENDVVTQRHVATNPAPAHAAPSNEVGLEQLQRILGAGAKGKP